MIYLNNAAGTFPKPVEVIAVIDHLKNIPQVDSSRIVSENSFDYLTGARRELSALFRLQEYKRVIFTSSATEALNIVIQGLAKYFPQCHVISSFREHNSVLRPLFHLLKEKKIFFTLIKSSKETLSFTEAIKKSIRNETKFIVLTHVNNVDGSLIDLEEIGEICRKNNIILVVDAAQSAGKEDIDFRKYKIDFLIFAGHKNLFGYPGIGGFVINSDIIVDPLKYGGTGVLSESLFQPMKLPHYYESGTINYIGVASLYAGCRYVNEIGVAAIKTKTEKMGKYFLELINNNDKIIINNLSLEPSGIISLNIKNASPDEIGFILSSSFDIVIRTGLHCAPLYHKNIRTYPKGSIRLSISYLNSFDDLGYAAHALNEISKKY